MNKIRLGFTETTLLLCWYLENNGINLNLFYDIQKTKINWLCSTSGFYDKKIVGTYFDFDTDKIKKNETYNNYFRRLFNFLKYDKNNFSLELGFHYNGCNLDKYRDEFLKLISKDEKPKHIFEVIDNKNVLIVNNLGSLIKKQFESGNLQKIIPNFPKNIKSIQYLENGYTFFNNGPDSSIFETAEKICKLILNYEFDIAIISAGAYSWLISEFILNNMEQKNVYVIGGDLGNIFGIKTRRYIKHLNEQQLNNYIDVPPEMRPPGYEKIENGCYW